MLRAFTVALLAFIAGVNAPAIVAHFEPAPVAAVPRKPAIDVEVWSESVPADKRVFWIDEVKRRYADAVIVFCHGNVILDEWCFFPDRDAGPFIIRDRPLKVVDGIAKLRAKYGSRRIVLVTCNPGHIRLPASLGAVSYATDNVWVIPDKGLDRNVAEPAVVGNVFELEEQ